jgi:Sec-independent protein secretion pathway component TatC
VNDCHEQGPTTGPTSAGPHHRAATRIRVTAVLIALHYLAPLDHLAGVSLLVSMIIGLVALAAMTAYQVWATSVPPSLGSVRSRLSPQPSRCSCCCSRPPIS